MRDALCPFPSHDLLRQSLHLISCLWYSTTILLHQVSTVVQHADIHKALDAIELAIDLSDTASAGPELAQIARRHVLIEWGKPARCGELRGPGYVDLHHIWSGGLKLKGGQELAVLIRCHRWQLQVVNLDLPGMQSVKRVDLRRLFARRVHVPGKLNSDRPTRASPTAGREQ